MNAIIHLVPSHFRIIFNTILSNQIRQLPTIFFFFCHVSRAAIQRSNPEERWVGWVFFFFFGGSSGFSGAITLGRCWRSGLVADRFDCLDISIHWSCAIDRQFLHRKKKAQTFATAIAIKQYMYVSYFASKLSSISSLNWAYFSLILHFANYCTFFLAVYVLKGCEPEWTSGPRSTLNWSTAALNIDWIGLILRNIIHFCGNIMECVSCEHCGWSTVCTR